ncbi:hypothetical protein [Rhodopirellula europaea]|uniref:hypothetical protein n=1 Tax=Rhodopirellula europaea TaxID=1263866 RepID=UPI000586CA61|nr:hypothetical protein [Rhodopirellula europaea]
MTKFKKSILAAFLVLGVLYLATWLVNRSERVTQEFSDHVSRGRYGAAAQMLTSSCSMKLGADGGLTLVDRDGNPTVVPAAKLPFKVGGGQPRDTAGTFSMTALGSSTNGTLDTPAVIMHLRVDGGRVCIERVES